MTVGPPPTYLAPAGHVGPIRQSTSYAIVSVRVGPLLRPVTSLRSPWRPMQHDLVAGGARLLLGPTVDDDLVRIVTVPKRSAGAARR